MLVLSRKIGETLHVGDDVVIEIKRVAGSRVTIAINAPREIRILRGEIMEAATAFDEPAKVTSAALTATTGPSSSTPTSGTASLGTPTSGTPTTKTIAEPTPTRAPLSRLVSETEPYLVSHPPVNPPGVAPGW